MQLRVAALNKAYSGDSHGIRGADYECHRQSKKANMKGSFRAFLSGRDQNLESIVKSKDAHLPLVNIKGEILFNSWKDIFTGTGAPFPVPPRIYSFDGRNVLTDSTWSVRLVPFLNVTSPPLCPGPTSLSGTEPTGGVFDTTKDTVMHGTRILDTGQDLPPIS